MFLNPSEVANSLASGLNTGVQNNQSGGMFNKGLSFLKEKPELASIILDYLGTGFAKRDEGNVASGLGTLLAKSSLNEKALKDIESKRTTDQEKLIKTFTDLIGGKMPTADSFTPGGKLGLSNIKVKPDKLGGTSYTVDFDTEDSPGIGPDNKPISSNKNVDNSTQLNAKRIYETLSPNFLMP